MSQAPRDDDADTAAGRVGNGRGGWQGGTGWSRDSRIKNQLFRVADFWQLDTDHPGRQSGSITDIMEHTNATMHHR